MNFKATNLYPASAMLGAGLYLAFAFDLHAARLVVDGRCNIFGAGHSGAASTPHPSGAGAGGGGLAPVFSPFTAASGQVLTFTNVTGTINVNFGPDASPDGNGIDSGTFKVGPWNGISSFEAQRYACLLGVFLSDLEPADPPPPPINFATIGLNFTNLAPAIGQAFYVGDGRTASGQIQQFCVPTNATRLFLGMPDTCGDGLPGWYSDNSGSFTADFVITNVALTNVTLVHVFTDRVDPRPGENYGLIPATFGYASGLQVTFTNTGGALKNPEVLGIPNAKATVIGSNTVRMSFGANLIKPAGWGVAGAAQNQVMLKVTSDACPIPVEIIWIAPVVNVIPRTLSSEVNDDSEPHLAANPAGNELLRTIGITTFSRTGGEWIGDSGTPWQQPENAPLWLSTNNGLTWDVRGRVPQPPARGGVPAPFRGPIDQTLAYNATGSRLYGAFLGLNNACPKTDTAYIRSTADPLTADFGDGLDFIPTGAGDLKVPDQPWIQVGPTVDGMDRVYVAINDYSLTNDAPGMGRTATLLVSTNNGVSTTTNRLDSGGPADRRTIHQDVAVRVAVNGDRVYAAFIRITGGRRVGNSFPGDVVVVRDDHGGIRDDVNNPNPFQRLGADGTSVTFPLPLFFARNAPFGAQRIGSDLSIAVDPRNNNVVYVAFRADLLHWGLDSGHPPLLLIYKSEDAGTSWSPIFAVPYAALPAMAVNTRGEWALLCAIFDPKKDRYMMKAYLNYKERVLESWPNFGDPATLYFGDYHYLTAVGERFYGTFSGDNSPTVDIKDDLDTDFPQGIVFQRNADFVANQLRDPSGALPDFLNPIVSSIDPYFFSLPSPAISLSVVVVEPAGSRRAVQVEASLTISWPISAENFVLEQTAQLPATWESVSVPPTQVGDEFVVTLPLTNTMKFFRLRAELPYSIAPFASSGGTLSPARTTNVRAGTNLVFTASPEPNYVIGPWLLDGEPAQTGGNTYALNNIQADHSVIVTFIPVNDLAVTGFPDPPPVESEEDAEIPLGSDVVYTLQVFNTGANTMSNVTLTDTLPATLTFVSASSEQGSCNHFNGTASCALGNLNPGAMVTVTVTARPTVLGKQVSTITVSGTPAEVDFSNNTTTIVVDIVPAP